MTLLIVLILFAASMCGGLLVKLIGSSGGRTITYPLIFAGSFLFSITIIHILPEVFSMSENPMKIGLFVLLGFFFQQFLEYFTSGIEHGHFHAHHQLSGASRSGLLIALVIHSLLEGALLTHESPFHAQQESYALLLGIVLHKIPAAFALTATLKEKDRFPTSLWVILIIFSMASPIGLVISGELISFSPELLTLLFALVSGSFLHISTTIFVESSPDHHFGIRKFVISLLGAGLAIATEYIV